MSKLPKPLEKAISEYSRLPGLGPKSAARIVFYLLSLPTDVAEDLATVTKDLSQKIKHCKNCFNYTEADLCSICTDASRQSGQVIVVENALDLQAFEETGYKGLYHVLGGLISPLQGIGPEQLSISGLISRLGNDSSSIQEIVLACPTSLEGEATANYIQSSLSSIQSLNSIKITRLARGLPTNSGIDYQDPATLLNSFNNRS